MQFRTKDLLITVLPKSPVADADLARVCLWHTRICTAPTFCQFRTCMVGGSWGCPHGTIFCPRNTEGTGMCPRNTERDVCGYANSCGVGGSACDPTIFCPGGSLDPWVLNDLEDLVTLRVELQETLKQLTELEKALPSGIRSKDDAAALERGLKEVLEQVGKTAKRLK